MTPEMLDRLLARFRRQLTLTHATRVGLVVVFAGAILWASGSPEPGDRRSAFLFGLAALLGWVIAGVNAARVAREVQIGSVLSSSGQLDDAEVWLRRAMERFSLSMHSKLLAGQQFASLLSRRDAHRDVIAVCRELLRHRLPRVRNLWLNVRLLLADSLLMLNRVDDAYEAIRPIYDVPLSLGERVKLLQIQLRYELAADHSASAAQALEEKVEIAEMMDSAGAALVHALLAEACRRESKPRLQQFLAERAHLYHDLPEIADRYPVIAPIAGRADRA